MTIDMEDQQRDEKPDRSEPRGLRSVSLRGPVSSAAVAAAAARRALASRPEATGFRWAA